MALRKFFLLIILICVFSLQATFFFHAFARTDEKSIVLTVWWEKDGEKRPFTKRERGVGGDRKITMFRYGSSEPLASIMIPDRGDNEGYVKFNVPDSGTYVFRSYPFAYAPYEGELTVKMSETENIVREEFVLKPADIKTIKGNLTTDTGIPLYPAKISGFRNGSSKGMYSSETDENGNFSIKVFSGYDEELKVTSFYLKEREISIPLTEEIITQDKSEWVVSGKRLSAEVEVFFDDGNEIKPYTLDLAKKIDGNVYLHVLDLHPETSAEIKGNIAFFYDLPPDFECYFKSVRLFGEKPDVWSREKEYPIIDGDKSFQIEENSPPLKLKVVVGNLKKKTCSGIVMNTKGDPISKAKIYFKHEETFYKYKKGFSGKGFSGESDDEGKFEVDLPEGEYEIRVNAPEYEWLITKADVKKDEKWEFKLHSLLRFRGLVVNSDGEPLDKVIVRFLNISSSGTALTDQNGHFVIKKLMKRQKKYTVMANKDGWATQIEEWRLGDSTDLYIVMQKGSLIQGQLDGIKPFADNKKPHLVMTPEGFKFPYGSSCTIEKDLSYKIRLTNGNYSAMLVVYNRSDREKSFCVPTEEFVIDDDTSELELSIDMNKKLNLLDFKNSLKD